MPRNTPPETINTVNWPDPRLDPEWASTGEGGLWALAVWDEESSTMTHDCAVDTLPHLPYPDVLAGKDATTVLRQYWSYSYESDALESENTESYPFLGVLLLGSTVDSWYSEERGEYFTVNHWDLGKEMQIVLAELDKHYGVNSRILTFLDT